MKQHAVLTRRPSSNIQMDPGNIINGDQKLPDTRSRLALSPLKCIQKKIPLGSEILRITVRSGILRIMVGAPLKACCPLPLTRLSVYVYARAVVLLNVCHPSLCLLRDYSQDRSVSQQWGTLALRSREFGP